MPSASVACQPVEETPTVPCVEDDDPYGGSTDEEMEEGEGK